MKRLGSASLIPSLTVLLCGLGSWGVAQPPAATQPAPAQPAGAAETPAPGADDTAAPAAKDPMPKADDKTPPPTPLPPDYKPPREPHPAELITKEIVPEFDGKPGLVWLKQNQAAFTKAMNGGNLVGPARELIRRGIAVQVLRLSLEDERSKLSENRSTVKRMIDRAASLQNKANTRRQFREFVLDRVIENCVKLLDNQLRVRITAMILLNHAYVEQENPAKGRETEFYTSTADTFLKILQDDEQHDGVRIWAANGLKKVLLEGRPRNQQRYEIAQALMEQALPGRNFPWLDMRIIDAAGDVGIVRFGGGKPIVVDGLCKIVNDESRDPVIRSEAAKQLSRIKADPSYNLSLFAYEAVRLTKDMAIGQAKSPQSARWRVGALNVYVMFVGKDRDERSRREAGLLVRAKGTQHEEYVTKAFNQILPILRHSMGQSWRRPIPGQAALQLDNWLKSNPPKDSKPTPDLEALDVKRVAETPPATDPAG